MIISAGKSHGKAGLRMERGSGFPHWTAGFFRGGLTEIVCDGQTWLLPGQHAVIIAPGSPYKFTLKEPQNEVWMIFDPRQHLQEVLQTGQGHVSSFAVSFPELDSWAEVDAGLNELLKRWSDRVPHLLLAENAMERVLLLASEARNQQSPDIADERIGQVIAYITAHLNQELTITDLARAAGLSVSRFSCLFKERTGVAPVKFLEKRRIEKAKYLLHTTDLPVQQVGLQVGFSNAQHFSTRFRKLTGQAPRDFREAPSQRFDELDREKT